MDNVYLVHHGTKGMRWGIRRYQNKDGSLTPAGKKRYDKEMKKLREEEQLIKNREATKAKLAKLDAKRQDLDARKAALDNDPEQKIAETKLKTVEGNTSKTFKTGKRKRIKDMSTEELRAIKERLQLEKECKDLMRSTRDESLTKGKNFVENVLTKSGENLATQVLNHFGAKALNELININADKDKKVDVIFANNKRK